MHNCIHEWTHMRASICRDRGAPPEGAEGRFTMHLRAPQYFVAECTIKTQMNYKGWLWVCSCLQLMSLVFSAIYINYLQPFLQLMALYTCALLVHFSKSKSTCLTDANEIISLSIKLVTIAA